MAAFSCAICADLTKSLIYQRVVVDPEAYTGHPGEDFAKHMIGQVVKHAKSCKLTEALKAELSQGSLEMQALLVELEGYHPQLGMGGFVQHQTDIQGMPVERTLPQFDTSIHPSNLYVTPEMHAYQVQGMLKNNEIRLALDAAYPPKQDVGLGIMMPVDPNAATPMHDADQRIYPVDHTNMYMPPRAQPQANVDGEDDGELTPRPQHTIISVEELMDDMGIDPSDMDMDMDTDTPKLLTAPSTTSTLFDITHYAPLLSSSPPTSPLFTAPSPFSPPQATPPSSAFLSPNAPSVNPSSSASQISPALSSPVVAQDEGQPMRQMTLREAAREKPLAFLRALDEKVKNERGGMEDMVKAVQVGGWLDGLEDNDVLMGSGDVSGAYVE